MTNKTTEVEVMRINIVRKTTVGERKAKSYTVFEFSLDSFALMCKIWKIIFEKYPICLNYTEMNQ